MTRANEFQQKILEEIKTRMPSGISMADVIAADLGLSTDSAYRRIRGDKMLSLEETYTLCMKYRISLDHLMSAQTDSFLFSGKFIQSETFRFDDYLQNVLQQVKFMNGFERREMIYMCKDIPLFHLFTFKEIAAFKYYFWMKNILHFPEFANKKFRLDDYPDEFYQISLKALEYYNNIDSIEVWNIESINSSIRQVNFYNDYNAFSNKDEIYMLYDALERLVNHLEEQATEGYKFRYNDPERKRLAGYKMYFNEIIILENTILATLDDSKMAFLVHSVLNVMITRDVKFCDHTYRYIQNLIKKSTLISSVSERERIRFFKSLKQRIKRRKAHLK